ncbi:MAG TPA: TldD/PmbA family protein [Labilithrix sp.]|nr:TldD/PmbA family protein [Labilithrix sp.]
MSNDVIELGAIAENVLAVAASAAKGAEIFATAQRNRSANVRFAKNEMTTSGEFDEVTVGVSVALGQRHAATSTNQTDAASLKALVERAVSMARLSPVDPESMPLLPPQQYAKTLAPFDMKLAAFGPEERAAIAMRAIAEGDAKKVQIAGFYHREILEQAARSSTGLSAAQRETVGSYTVTARTADATGSGWGGREVHRAADLDDVTLSRTAIDKALRSASPKAVPPGKYTVILEPQAVAEMLQFLVGEMDLRSIDEGRSFFTGKVGKKVFADLVSLRSDPTDPETPSAAYDEEGMPLGPQAWIDAGVARDMYASRYWAQKQGVKPSGNQEVFKLSGGKAESVDELIAGTKRGLLVTRFWYNRMLEPQSIMLTGLTRDGLFLVENGKITGPATNFRYNESPVSVLRNVDAMTRKTVRVPGVNGKWHVPALRTNEFTMASPSAAV